MSKVFGERPVQFPAGPENWVTAQSIRLRLSPFFIVKRDLAALDKRR